jgi:hypothetical protein
MTFLRIVICSQSMLCRVSRLGGQRFPGGVLEQDKHYAALDGLRGFCRRFGRDFPYWPLVAIACGECGARRRCFLLPQRLCPVARLWQAAGEDPF